MSPHLFTHLFYEGVIVSTRKLVYDASASEDAIKSLMQAQHKAVLKDLKIHTFDDKIDAYLGNTPGLEPRESVGGGPRVSDPEISIEPAEGRAHTEPSGPPSEQFELRQPEPAKAARAKRKSTVPPPKQSVPAAVIDEPSKPRTKTAERTSRGSQFRSIPPPEVAPPAEDSTPEDIQAGLTVPTPSRVPTPPSPPPRARAATPPPIPQRAGASKTAITIDSSPEIEIISHESESGRTRGPRDTAVDNSFEDAIPSAIGPDATIPSDGIPPRPFASPSEAARPGSASRPPGAAQGAALLPAMRQPSRPAITPPSVVSRPLPPDPNRVGRGDSEAIEIYAPAPPSVEPPPGERTERPGQYSMNRRREIASQENVPLREHSNRVAVPAGLARPRPPNQSGGSPIVRSSSPSPLPTPPGSGRITTPSQSDGVVRTPPQPQSDGVPQLPERPLPPARTPHITAPIASRTGVVAGAGNVITTRPAVIVGAPPRPPGTPNPQRVRKAREDEGRGFGQGLISEKSLDEVILAYLSEDADEK
ncbi:MAG TPA: hypothetical protein VF403_08410 [Kofleriaceae bacterium]